MPGSNETIIEHSRITANKGSDSSEYRGNHKLFFVIGRSKKDYEQFNQNPSASGFIRQRFYAELNARVS